MSLNILFHSAPHRWADYRTVLPDALAAAGVDARLSTDLPPEEADYIVYAPAEDRLDLSRCGRLKAVLSLWAGIEGIADDVPREIPLTRMVDEGLTAGMVEYVTGHVLRHHLGMDAHIVNPDHEWRPVPPPLAADRKVTILGLGALGTACGRALAGLGFAVSGWSRSPKEIDGIRCHSADDGLATALDGAEIVVLLLPLTADTECVLDGPALGRLADGAVVINPGRGGLVDDDALLAALETGQVGHATLDTFRVEPLPQDHPYWSHPRVTVTPHVASETRPASASRVIAENVRRAEAGEPLLHVVDRSAGY
ncbi:2-hydroxyacid dehydrogenase [Wenxinia marina]|uniref:Phosphoglycerate dehydrogenase n=1 Tax=Wenxinia marina DSM 24838 TaxID=1123501 RepID=A0A0D0PGG9_9RHOB|nr:glyoxylate/hydroxypyruvate reductase A [Wenxinia marina]KIQ70451.1 Phosphoglycerate dehydrogenase [Wenxinia marina DSM 24838]GGL53055.1 glyoxylate/hydroxypyruvate reductase A [Wenxinia marina]